MTTITTSPQPYPLSRSDRKQKGSVVEPGQKPKKVNSEIRKQQNRIASRNYREKRKQKLQYLQRLLRDQDPNDEQYEASPSEASHDGRERSISAEYYAQRPIANSEILPSNANFSPIPSSSRCVVDSVIVPTTTYDSNLLEASHPFPTLESPWNAPVYEPQAQGHISSWNIPHWMPSIDFTPQISSTHDEFRFTPPQTQQVYQQLPTPPQQALEPVSNADLFILGDFNHCRRTQNQTRGNSNVSPCPPFPYPPAPGQYFGPS
ncbi:hypothetical protein K505DRAFT_367760 [Melanomma pulvis-pyrius CBS 109.77]|uniref:BZIP domain-containing protein n=1 Tax=Melanomma pulvis-pyrius CBS 109.77 TaxID=1314802 RepID=A0A6A6WS91_9PLEO|nr:hypothetical protein K505DRAFT_367760 [Melanomma pulvis-pyrius CBS 109.77]